MTGLTEKFRVERVNLDAQVRHRHCQHFVLDVDHDPHALPALLAYASSCDAASPELAADLRRLVTSRGGVRS